MRSGLLLPCFLILMMFQPVRAQFQDLQLWADFTVRYDVNSKLRISLEEELRYFENISRLDKFNSELLALYRFNRTFDAGIFYRLITNRNPEGYYYLRHRFGMVAQATRDYGPWEFRIRLQGQSTYPDFFRSENWQVPENYLRLKFSTSRETRSKKIIPFTDIEFWYAFRTGQSDIIDKYRLTAGIDIRQDIRNRWSVFYRLNQELQVNNPLTAHILGIGYTWIIR